jgi:hypothetical protein
MAERANIGPHVLTLAELDGVTAGGVELGVSTAALALGGSFVLTSVNAGGSATHTPLPGGGFMASGVVGGSATAVGTSGTTTTATKVSTSGSTSGTTLVNTTVGGTLAGAGGQASFGFTYVSGGTVFLP